MHAIVRCSPRDVPRVPLLGDAWQSCVKEAKCKAVPKNVLLEAPRVKVKSGLQHGDAKCHLINGPALGPGPIIKLKFCHK
jgi:hypothetical protein